MFIRTILKFEEDEPVNIKSSYTNLRTLFPKDTKKKNVS